MAKQGFYEDPPSRRWAYDEDGTQVYRIDPNNAITVTANSVLRNLNDETNTMGFGGGTQFTYGYVLFMFPELRTLTHVFLSNGTAQFNQSTSVPISYSTDSTNGIDGTWISAGTVTSISTNVAPAFRTSIVTLPIDSMKALRLYYGRTGAVETLGVNSIHLYGFKVAGETPHRVDFVSSDGSELVRDLDYGDQPRGVARIWTPTETWNQNSGLYLRNRSPDKVAQNITVLPQSLSGNMINNITLSKDNVVFGTQVTYTEIQPSQIVGPVFVKHNVPVSNVLGLAASRLKLSVGNWL